MCLIGLLLRFVGCGLSFDYASIVTSTGHSLVAFNDLKNCSQKHIDVSNVLQDFVRRAEREAGGLTELAVANPGIVVDVVLVEMVVMPN